MYIILAILTCICFVFLFGRLFLFPIKKVLKLIVNSLLGSILILIINYIGLFFNFHIGLNYITAIIVGVLGVPGAVLLIILKIFIQL